MAGAYKKTQSGRAGEKERISVFTLRKKRILRIEKTTMEKQIRLARYPQSGNMWGQRCDTRYFTLQHALFASTVFR